MAYNYAACPHGYLLEGRGIGKRTGTNGNQALNQAHYAIVALLGSSGLTKPTEAMLSALRDGIELLRQHGAGDEIKGHRDGYTTQCPGDALYAWVKKGAPRPEGTQPAQGPACEPYPGAAFFMKGSRPALGKSSPVFTAMGKRLVAVGCGRYTRSVRARYSVKPTWTRTRPGRGPADSPDRVPSGLRDPLRGPSSRSRRSDSRTLPLVSLWRERQRPRSPSWRSRAFSCV